MAKQVSSLDFAFFTQLWHYYKVNRGRIRRNYRELTRKYLDYNDPTTNINEWKLRQPQFEALEMYVFLKEYLENKPVHLLFKEWSESKGKFEGRTAVSNDMQQPSLFDMQTEDQFEDVFKYMRKFKRPYANYIFALTMGTGKTILMATCIFYEFLLANKFPKDEKYCHNALVFAPDKTVLQSLREIQTFDKSRVVPPEYVNWLNTNIHFHFLEDSGSTLNILDKSRFNIVISNTQKIILKRQHKEKSLMERMFSSTSPTYEAGSVYEEFEDLYDFDVPEDETELSTNQRFEKLRRVEQLGIYVDEAHHAFGNQLERDMGIRKTKTSLALTIDELAASLKNAGTRVVAAYNYTGTPYVKNRILPEVVYAFGLQEAIDKMYLKKVRIHSYTNPKSDEFVNFAIDSFLESVDLNERHEGLLPKMAFFASQVEELQKELRPAVEAALARHGISIDKILVNVGDEKITSNADIREFNRLDYPDSDKQFILLVNKGREGWNCRSLFSVALYRKPRSKIFVLQASMRCLRSIGAGQQTGHVYLSEENREILEDELQQNFRVSVDDLESRGSDRERVKIKVNEPVEKIKLKRVRRRYDLRERELQDGYSFEFEKADTEKYRLTYTQTEGLTSDGKKVTEEDITHLREKREFTSITLVAEIARYLNKPCLEIEDILEVTAEKIDGILVEVNKFNELLYDWVIPKLFDLLYEVEEFEREEEYEVDLVKVPDDGFYEMSAKKELIIYQNQVEENADKTFHLDTYCFDSNPERQLFWDLLAADKVKKIYFTGMLTHGQSEFFVQYIDPESHTIRSYYPDFLVQIDDGSYIIVEVKGDNKIEDPVVLAKESFAKEMAGASGMRYTMIKGSDANKGYYQMVLDPDFIPPSTNHDSQKIL